MWDPFAQVIEQRLFIWNGGVAGFSVFIKQLDLERQASSIESASAHLQGDAIESLDVIGAMPDPPEWAPAPHSSALEHTAAHACK